MCDSRVDLVCSLDAVVVAPALDVVVLAALVDLAAVVDVAAAGLAAVDEVAAAATYSLRRVEVSSGNGISTSRLRIEAAGGRSVDELAKSFPFGPSNARWFRVLNGLAPTAILAADKRVKVVAN